jgi:DNA-nicking Smr family endonuclease
MTPDGDDKSESSFADLIGETRPVKGNKEVLSPAARATPNAKRMDPRSSSPTSAPIRFRRPDAQEPRLAAAPGVSDKQLLELRRGDKETEERIDFHGLREEAAGRHLAQRLESAIARGLRCVIVIHGRGTSNEGGDAVLRERLPGWLMKPPNAERVLAFAPAPAKLGGEGATLVLLRKS